MLSKRSVSQIKANLLRPALTSHFEVEIPLVGGTGGEFSTFLSNNRVTLNQDKLNLLCFEATLPGSNLATLELTSDFHGVTERHAYRRVYDDRIDLSFYVNGEDYLPIRFFETWIKYIVDESISSQSDKDAGSTDPFYFYRARYPDKYVAYQGLKVIKFERDYLSPLQYDFIGAFPISISSMPISYESSSLLKCTVSMTYLRYVLQTGEYPTEPQPQQNTEPLNTEPAPTAKTTPTSQAEFNSQNLGRVITNEYYNNFGDNRQNATNTGDFFNGTVAGPFGTAVG
jgi:hypothetical protein